MNQSTEQMIPASDYTQFCVGKKVIAERTIEGWIKQSDNWKQLDIGIAPSNKKNGELGLGVSGGGTGSGLPRECVIDMFHAGVIAIDPEKIKGSFFGPKFEQFKSKYKLTKADLSPSVSS